MVVQVPPHPTVYSDRLVTADELAAMLAHDRCELVLGRLVPVAPASTDHGSLGSNLTRLVMNHVHDNRLGRTYIADTGFDITRPGRRRADRARPRPGVHPGRPCPRGGPQARLQAGRARFCLRDRLGRWDPRADGG